MGEPGLACHANRVSKIPKIPPIVFAWIATRKPVLVQLNGIWLRSHIEGV